MKIETYKTCPHGEWRRGLLLGSLLVLILVSTGCAGGANAAGGEPGAALKIAVVGDTGMGAKGFHPGFLGVMRAVQKEKPDVLIHVGDYIYYGCDASGLAEFESKLVVPFKNALRIFIPGDNDLETPNCMKKYFAFNSETWQTGGGLPYQGTLEKENVLYVALNTGKDGVPLADPTDWLKPRIDQAKARGKWVVLVMHEPPLTTAWFLDKRKTDLAWINALQPDLVISGHQHSYERFHSLGVTLADGTVPVTKPVDGIYQRGAGSIHIVSGGGGATFKPFSDLTGNKKHTAPEQILNQALAERGLMNHFLILEIDAESLKETTWRVCAEYDPETTDPRWRSSSSMWDGIKLDCDGEPPGATPVDAFEAR